MEKVEKGTAEREKGLVSEDKLSFRNLVKAANTAREIPADKPASISTMGGQPNCFENDQIVYELTDIVEEPSSKGLTVAEFNAEIMKKVSEIAEKIAREMIPDIVERVIREEIEKLKTGESSTDNNV